ncbi:sugar phosphate isomerase/epimerase family protein [Parasphingorhabdus halotolerans]|uniref:Sugar phosphate isomerase/epimerase n=1 Tax=Parasphingorhabdus halotolerans TaxID=2725558 RepID=A0A6H2DPT2_9SPHN|nr:sugar phosphate isomerase/epimerase [Parasphingorhabdus halotolerans]QJB70208.1 sugar phosphate isomerase/epimerase [Parasphingorhabdus halotolerans]
MTQILSLAAGTLPEFQPAQVADAAGQAGFSHVGFTIEADKWDTGAMKATKTAIAAQSLSVLDVEVLWIPEGGQVGDEHHLIIDAGMELGASNALVVSAEPDKDRTADALHQLCEWADPGNMRVALEFLMITAVQSMDDALSIIQRADHSAAALLIDTIHFQRAGHQPNELENVDPRLLPYSQICDGNLACEASFEHYLEDAIDLRSAPGEGELPVNEILRALPANVPLSLEVRSKAYREQYPDAAERAEAVRAQSLRYFDAIGVSVS